MRILNLIINLKFKIICSFVFVFGYLYFTFAIANNIDVQSNALKWPSPCSEYVQKSEHDLSNRMPPLSDEEMTFSQKQAAKELASGPRKCIFGPFSILLRSPELLTRTQLLGEYLRFHGALPQRLREMTMLIVGKAWNQPYIWYIHEPIAIKSGLQVDIINAIAQDTHPRNMTESEVAVYDFSMQLLKKHKVNNETYLKNKKLFGEKGIVELTAINGYFSMLAMMLNVSNTPIPKNVKIPLTLTK